MYMSQTRMLLFAVCLSITASVSRAANSQPAASGAPQPRPVDLVICLDTSGSMTQLIDSARAKLWEIVNELVKIEEDVVLRVGLLTYGSPSLSTADQGYVVYQSDLTRDLDTIYDKMMRMSTNGGDEYVGWVLGDALRKMSWSTDPRALKIIYVCGNESADQARRTHDFRTVSQQVGEQSVVINAIYAGDRQQGINEGWSEVAQYGQGDFFAIDTGAGLIQIDTPQDPILAELNIKINATYIPYGVHGKAGLHNQSRQDQNAQRMGHQTSNSRNISKATSSYFNGHWDLVDASEQEGFELEEVDVSTLPENMRSMTLSERRSYIEGRRAERKLLQEQILALAKQRDEYLTGAYKKLDTGIPLDEAIRSSLRKQAAKKGLTLSN